MVRTFPATTADPRFDDSASLQQLWLPIFVLGLMALFIGLLVIIAPHLGISVFVAILGALLIINGIAEVIHAVLVRKWKIFALHLLAAALYLLVGLFILEDRDRAASVLGLLLAAAFLVGGLLRVVFSLSVQFPAWWWVLINGVVDLIIGIVFVTGWAGPSYAVIGLLVGLDLLFHSWTWLALSWYVRTLPAQAVDPAGRATAGVPLDRQVDYRP